MYGTTGGGGTYGAGGFVPVHTAGTATGQRDARGAQRRRTPWSHDCGGRQLDSPLAQCSLLDTIDTMKTPQTTVAGGLLLDTRRRAGLTQMEVSRRSGVVRPLISLYENGKKDPSLTTLNRLIEACGMALTMRADILSPAELAQRSRDAEVGLARAQENATRARASLVELRDPTSAERASSRG